MIEMMKAKKLSSLILRSDKLSLSLCHQYNYKHSSSAAALLSSPAEDETPGFGSSPEVSTRKNEMKAKKTLSSLFRSAFKYKPSSSAASQSSPAEDATLDEFVSGGTSPDAGSVEKLVEGIIWWPLRVCGREISRKRKNRFAFRTTQDCSAKIVDACITELGFESAMQLLGTVPRGMKDCNALIKSCIEGARNAPDEVVAERHMQLAFKVFNIMKEHGFPLEEETYGPILESLLDMGMTKEFSICCRIIEQRNPWSVSRLRYYERKLWRS